MEPDFSLNMLMILHTCNAISVEAEQKGELKESDWQKEKKEALARKKAAEEMKDSTESTHLSQDQYILPWFSIS